MARIKKMNVSESAILERRSKPEKVLFGIIFAIFVVYALSLVFPFLYMLMNSFKDTYAYLEESFGGGTHLTLPSEWVFTNYVSAFTEMSVRNSRGEEVGFLLMFLNSIWY